MAKQSLNQHRQGVPDKGFEQMFPGKYISILNVQLNEVLPSHIFVSFKLNYQSCFWSLSSLVF